MADVLIEWQNLVATVERAGDLRDVILKSWNRSHSAGLDPTNPKFRLRRVPRGELQARLDEAQGLLAIVRPHLDWIAQAMAPVAHVVYVADRDGIVLESRGTDERMQEEYGLLPGYDWSEGRMGTNGAGTALESGRPVAVFGEEHFLKPFKGFICVAAPIRDGSGRIIAALDMSTSVADGDPRNLLLIAHAAFAIERELLQTPLPTPIVSRMASAT